MKIRLLDGVAGTLPDGTEFVWAPNDEVDVPAEFAKAFLEGDDPTAEPIAEKRVAARETRKAAA